MSAADVTRTLWACAVTGAVHPLLLQELTRRLQGAASVQSALDASTAVWALGRIALVTGPAAFRHLHADLTQARSGCAQRRLSHPCAHS